MGIPRGQQAVKKYLWWIDMIFWFLILRKKGYGMATAQRFSSSNGN